MRLEVERILRATRVEGLNRFDGEAIAPEQIAERVQALAKEDR